MSLTLALALFALQSSGPVPYRPHALPVRRPTWLSKDDFPAEQVAAASPAFTARLDVGADGTVGGCTITKASGQAAFDARACDVLSKRGRFLPALDPGGAAMASAYTYRLPWAAVTRPVARGGGAWVTAEDYPSAALRQERTGRTVALVSIEADGRVSGCEVTTTSGHADLDEATCRIVTLRGRYQPATDADGAAVASEQSYAVNWALPG